MPTPASIQGATAALLQVTLTSFQGELDAHAPNARADDARIKAQVTAALRHARSLKSAEIRVDTFKRRVLLSGRVSTVADRERAAALARTVPGVSDVRNRLSLK